MNNSNEMQRALLASTDCQRIYISPDLEVVVHGEVKEDSLGAKIARGGMENSQGTYIEVRASDGAKIMVLQDTASRDDLKDANGPVGAHKAVFFVSVPRGSQPLAPKNQKG